MNPDLTRQTIIPMLVLPEEVTNASALFSVSLNLSRLLGAAIVAFLLPTFGVEACFLINILSCVPILMGLQWIGPLDTPHSSPSRVKRRSSVGQPLVQICHSAELRSVFLSALAVSLFGGPLFLAFLPVIASHVSHLGSTGIGVLGTAFGLGAIVGTMALATLPHGQVRWRVLFWTTGGAGMCIFAIGWVPVFPLTLMFASGLGACTSIVTAAGTGLLHEVVPASLRRSLFPFWNMVLNGLSPVSVYAVGVIVQRTNTVALSLTVAAMGCLLLALVNGAPIWKPAIVSWVKRTHSFLAMLMV